VDDARQRFGVAVAPDAEVLRADARFGQNGSGFAEDDGGTSDGAAAEMDEVPVVGESVFARVLAHGRNSDAVAKRNGANCQRFE
jgi:hypothetical protein